MSEDEEVIINELSRKDCIKILKDFIVTDRKIRNNRTESDYEVFCEIRCKAIETILNDNQKLDRENQILFEDILENYVSKKAIRKLADFAINATGTIDDYSIGMYNGIIYLKSVLLNEKIAYKKCENSSIPKYVILEKIKEKQERIKKLHPASDCVIIDDLENQIKAYEELLRE